MTISQLGGSIDVAPRDPARTPPGTVMEVLLPYLRDEPPHAEPTPAQRGAGAPAPTEP